MNRFINYLGFTSSLILTNIFAIILLLYVSFRLDLPYYAGLIISIILILSHSYKVFVNLTLKEDGTVDYKNTLVNIDKTSKRIYNLSIIIFFFISFCTVFFGFKALGEIHSLLDNSLVLLYSAVVNIVLYAITRFIKANKDFSFIILATLLFILIDITAVFPFNFLFFHDIFEKSYAVEHKTIEAQNKYDLYFKLNTDSANIYKQKIDLLYSKDEQKKTLQNANIDALKKLNSELKSNSEIMNKGFIQSQTRNAGNSIARALVGNLKDDKNIEIKSEINSKHKRFSDNLTTLKEAKETFEAQKKKDTSLTQKEKTLDEYFEKISEAMVLTNDSSQSNESLSEFNVISQSKLKTLMNIVNFLIEKFTDPSSSLNSEDKNPFSNFLLRISLVIDFVPLLICYLFVIFYKIQGHEEVVPIDTEPKVNNNIVSSIKALWNKFTTWVNKD